MFKKFLKVLKVSCPINEHGTQKLRQEKPLHSVMSEHDVIDVITQK